MRKAFLPLVVLGFVAVSAPAMAVPTRVMFGFTSSSSTVELVIDGSTVIQASSTGWYSALGFHDSTNPNYFVGLCDEACAPVGEYHDFAVFDLGEGVSPTSAVIRLFNPSTPDAGYISSNPSELFTLYDVSTGVRDLVADQSDATDIFADLGSGLVYGSRVVSAADDGTYVEIALSAAALDSLSSAVGTWSVGGALDLSREPGPEPEPVPEPATLLLLGSGLVVGRRLRRR